MVFLIKCRACGKEVSSEASPPCPHCKDPFITQKRADDRKKEQQKEEAERKWRLERDEEWNRINAIWKSGICVRCGAQIKPWNFKPEWGIPDNAQYYCPSCNLCDDGNLYGHSDYLHTLIRLHLDNSMPFGSEPKKPSPLSPKFLKVSPPLQQTAPSPRIMPVKGSGKEDTVSKTKPPLKALEKLNKRMQPITEKLTSTFQDEGYLKRFMEELTHKTAPSPIRMSESGYGEEGTVRVTVSKPESLAKPSPQAVVKKNDSGEVNCFLCHEKYRTSDYDSCPRCGSNEVFSHALEANRQRKEGEAERKWRAGYYQSGNFDW